ncbi:MAG: hypothetical protein K1X85_07420 [Ignavibacteria bacterium]|nr:hypothetical protein [Ignavibacteria bacterium]
MTIRFEIDVLKLFRIASFLMFCCFIVVSCAKNRQDRDAKQVAADSAEDEHEKKPQKVEDATVSVSISPDSSHSEVSYSLSELPESLLTKVNGIPVAYAGFRDSLGMNHFVLTETEQENTGDGVASKYLYAYDFVEGRIEVLWKINDFIKDCMVDVTLEYIDNSLSVTDLDKDGVFETSFLYKLSCKGDVSPDGLKLIMHEGPAKYAVRGVMDLQVTEYGLEKGEMVIDQSFNKAPVEFREFAVERWNMFKLERIGN